MPTNFSARAEFRDGVTVLLVSGEVDLGTAPRLLEAIELTATPASPLIVDLTAVDFLDSAGCRALALGERVVSGEGGRLMIVPGAPIARIFEIAGLDLVFELHAKLESALDLARAIEPREPDGAV